MSLHRSRGSESTSGDYTAAVQATAEVQSVTSTDADVLVVGQFTDGGLNIGVAQAYLSFDTTSVGVTPSTSLAIALTVAATQAQDNAWTLGCSPWNWGSAVDLSTWRTPSQLAGLAGSTSTVFDPSYNMDDLFVVTASVTDLNVGGITRFILYSGDDISAIPPVGTEALAFYGDGGASPPVLYIDGSPFVEGGSGPPVCNTDTPHTGSDAGGTSVVLSGSGFTGATAVHFGSTPAAFFNVDSDSQITCVSPAHAAGTVNITVTTPGGTSA
jgi:IPT/TIG domain